jgi:hypothetical protein
MSGRAAPERDAASTRKDEQMARDLNWLCNAHALQLVKILFAHNHCRLMPPRSPVN